MTINQFFNIGTKFLIFQKRIIKIPHTLAWTVNGKEPGIIAVYTTVSLLLTYATQRREVTISRLMAEPNRR